MNHTYTDSDNEYDEEIKNYKIEEFVDLHIDKLVDMKFKMKEHVEFYSIPLLQYWDVNVWIDFIEKI